MRPSYGLLRAFEDRIIGTLIGAAVALIVLITQNGNLW
jgi:uncharacterized membrane protein YccC